MVISLTENVQLKSITLEDYEILKELMERIYPPAYKYLWDDGGLWYLDYLYSREQVEKYINESQSSFYFVLVNEKQEGILKINFVEKFPEKPDLRATRLHRIYLSESYQGRGISTILMNHVKQVAKENESEIIWLDCMDSKHQALKYYKKHGFLTSQLNYLDYTGLIEKYRGIYNMWRFV